MVISKIVVQGDPHRFVAAAHAPASQPHSDRTSGPIRILFVLSCPRQREQLATEEEIRRIRDELERAPFRDRFEHKLEVAATYGHLRRKLRGYQPHILHIACYGTAGAELLLDDGQRGEERIDAATFVELLKVLRRDLQLVVVNACHSTAITGQLVPLVGLVVGMRGAVEDESAVSFPRSSTSRSPPATRSRPATAWASTNSVDDASTRTSPSSCRRAARSGGATSFRGRKHL